MNCKWLHGMNIRFTNYHLFNLSAAKLETRIKLLCDTIGMSCKVTGRCTHRLLGPRF